MSYRRIFGAAAFVSAILAGQAALAAQPAGDPSANAPPPDDSFLEFLGKDDVDDAKLWDFFKRPPPKDDADSGDDDTGEDQNK